MGELSPLDAVFLEIEDGDPHTSLSIASIAVLEGPPPRHHEFAEAMAARLPLLPRYRQRIRRVPLDLGPPVWVEDDRFDLDEHLHRIAAPAPGDENALCELVAMIMAERFERAHPLWEVWVVEGLAEGRWAVLYKIHHCLADGIAGAALLEELLAGSPDGGPASAGAADPGMVPLVLRSFRSLVTGPVELVRALTGELRRPARFVRQVTSATRGLALLSAALTPATPTTLAGPLGADRHYELAHASLADVRAVAGKTGGTVNDVVLAAVTGAFRDLLRRRGETPGSSAVRALVPVSVRAATDKSTVDNQISLMLPRLPVDLVTPSARLSAVRHRMSVLKTGGEASGGSALIGLARFLPFAPMAFGVRVAAALPQRSVVAVATNVPGPSRSLSVLGRPVVDLYPYVPIAVRVRTGIAVLTYGDRMTFGITTDRDSSPEPGFLGKAIEHELAALSASR